MNLGRSGLKGSAARKPRPASGDRPRRKKQVFSLRKTASLLAEGLVLLSLLSTGCGGNGGATAPTPPVLRNLEHRLAAGDSHSVALDADGNIWSWGANHAGQLGNRTTEPSRRPIGVFGLSGATAVSACTGQSLALKGDGTVWAWGQNALGYIGADMIPVPVLCTHGYPLTANVTAPVQVAGLDRMVQISAGFLYVVALRADGTVWTWGSNSSGQLGIGAAADHVCLPTQVAGLSGITAIAAGGSHALALKNDGTVWSWGDNSVGNLGNGTLIASNVPLQVAGLAGIRNIAASDHSVALDSAGNVWSWGSNSTGQVCNDRTEENCATVKVAYYTYACVKSPVRVEGLPAAEKIMAGSGVTYAIDKDGVVWGWGSSNQIGTTQSTSTCGMVRVTWPCISFPLRQPQLAGFSSIVAGFTSNHALSVKEDGFLWAWGNNSDAQLGDGSTIDSPLPVQVLGPTGSGRFNLDESYGASSAM